MKTVGELILKVEDLKKQYHSVGFKNLTTGYLDRTGIVENSGEWITNVGDFEGFGETLEKSLADLISKMENFEEFKIALKEYKIDIRKVS
ncbi:hypothetical protein [Cetobacterium sp.]|uniref:hypothetical protein n=1 Tax=Cetobacterium sp. TaxID=2071632 RepID=UPI003F3F166F